MIKVLYLAAGHGVIEPIDGVEIVYQDKYVARDIGGDMLFADISSYDIIVASPPCNWYSRANNFKQREKSKYSNETKHLLPDIIKRLQDLDKPIIIENVISKRRMIDIINSTRLHYYEIGRHCYFTNRMFDFSRIPQQVVGIDRPVLNRLTSTKRQGGFDVNIVFKWFIEMEVKQ